MRRIVALVALATLVACGGSDGSTSPTQTQGKSFTGTYVLQSVNGKALPYTWTRGSGDYFTIRSYSLTIGAAGSWSSATSEIYTTNGQVTDQPTGGQSGTYTYEAATRAVSLISLDQSTVLTGTVSADLTTLTVSQTSDIYVFKQ